MNELFNITNVNIKFTDREINIIELATKGMTNKEIGEALLISPETVKMVLKKIYRKLNIRSRVQLELFDFFKIAKKIPNGNRNLIE